MEKKKKKKLPLRKKLVGGYLLCMFTLFPVFCTDGYFNIRHDRYYFFLCLSLVALLLYGMLRVLGGGDDKDLPRNLQAVHTRRTGPWYRRLTFLDFAMLVFLVAAAVSTMLSQYPAEALLGSMGRNNGMLLLLVYGGVYFLISRWNVRSEAAFAGLAICTCFVSTVALLNFFCLDPLKMLSRLSLEDRRIFISTIGNKNLLSSYLCITLPAVSALFVHSQKKGMQLLYGLSSVLGFAAMICADSDSVFLGMGAFCLLGLLVYIREPGRMKRFLLVLTVMLLAAKVLFSAGQYLKLDSRGMGSLQQWLLFSPYTTVILVVMAVLTIALYCLHRGKKELRLPAMVQMIPVMVIAAGVAAVVTGMVYYTVIEPDRPLSEPWNLLRLDDNWGTHRGFMWKRSIEIFKGFSWKEKLVGTGPDTFYFTFQPYFQELSQYGNSSTNAAHNEYIHYLITQGLIGLGAYLALLIGSMINALRCAKKEPVFLVFFCALVGYAAQAVVNIAQPITTPLLIIFLSLAAGRLPDHRKKIPYVPHKK